MVKSNRDVLGLVLVEKKYTTKQCTVGIECGTDPLLYRECADVNFGLLDVVFRSAGLAIREGEPYPGPFFFVCDTAIPC